MTLTVSPEPLIGLNQRADARTSWENGREKGIRTLERLSPLFAFQASALSQLSHLSKMVVGVRFELTDGSSPSRRFKLRALGHAQPSY